MSAKIKASIRGKYEHLEKDKIKDKKSKHKGKTRVKDKPMFTFLVEADKNPATGNSNIEETGEYEERIITALLPF